jgi:hypothetical protein
MGPSQSNGGTGTAGDLGVIGALPAGFRANMPTANLYLASNEGGVDQFIDTTITIASLLGAWHKCNLLWSRATGFITLLLDGVQIATTNTNIPIALTDHKILFMYNSLTAGVINAGSRHLFDYVKLTYTVSR